MPDLCALIDRIEYAKPSPPSFIARIYDKSQPRNLNAGDHYRYAFVTQLGPFPTLDQAEAAAREKIGPA